MHYLIFVIFPDTFRLDSRERFNNNESDDDLLSNLQGDRDRGRQNGGRSSKQGRRGQSSRSKTGQRGSLSIFAAKISAMCILNCDILMVV